jgi:hypothetical protein
VVGIGSVRSIGAGVCALGLVLHAAGCNDGGGSGAFDSNSAGGSSGNGSVSDSTAASASGGSDSDTDPATSGGSTGEDDTDSGGIKLDVGAPGGGFDGCGCELSYIWIANAEQGTVSKIHTRTLEEEGRYYTRADGNGNPSRTSVNLSGDVAVANRHGGLTKFYSDPSKCEERNGVAGIQTSSGAADILSWDMEECRAWYTEFPTTNQRPVAWTPGTVTPGTCESTGEQVWTVGSATPSLPGTGGMGGVIAWLVNGDDGSIAEEVPIDGFSGLQLGAYGGAVDGQGNLYFVPMGGITFGDKFLARVDIETLDVELHLMPAGVSSYGVTVDHTGRPWVSSILGSGAARFDPETEEWDVISGFISAGGLAEGPNDMMWIATNVGANSVDIHTMMPGPVFALPGGGGTKGISVDTDGYVWAINEIAYKVNPDNGVPVGSYAGLTGPYTYSDMTGGALGSVTCPPAG